MYSPRPHFPILAKKINNHPLVYFDNAATSQKPQVVIDAVKNFYEQHNSNVHRGLNPLAEEATTMYEDAREKVRQFINAKHSQEIIFTRGATEGINLVAQAWGRQSVKKGDRVVLSIAEHHANVVPWLQLKEQIGIEIDYISLNDDYTLNIEEGKQLLAQKNVKLLALTLCSNVLGGIEHEAVKTLCVFARERGIVTLVDAAQAVVHTPVDVQKLGCDFVAFSGHKVFGPTGIGVLYGRREMLAAMPAWQGGGEMIREVFTDHFTPNELPCKFEAGTPNIAGAVGLGAAIDFVHEVGWSEIEKRERELTEYFLHKVKQHSVTTLYGSGAADNRTPVFALNIKGVHPHDAADILGEQGIIVRAGHHCAQPLHHYLQLEATLRASLSFYNTKAEIDVFFEEVEKVYKTFH